MRVSNRLIEMRVQLVGQFVALIWFCATLAFGAIGLDFLFHVAPRATAAAFPPLVLAGIAIAFYGHSLLSKWLSSLFFPSSLAHRGTIIDLVDESFHYTMLQTKEVLAIRSTDVDPDAVTTIINIGQLMPSPSGSSRATTILAGTRA